MRPTPNPSRRVAVVPSGTANGCWHWIIRAPDGTTVDRSPYAFASRAGARLSGEYRKREMSGGSASR